MVKIQEIFKVKIAYKTTILQDTSKTLIISKVYKSKTKNLKIIRIQFAYPN